MDEQILSGLIGVFLGAILGWLFNYIGYRTAVANANRRTTNKVLYSLLNIRFELLKLNSEKNVDEAIAVMEKTMGGKIPNELREQVKLQISETGSELMKDSVYDNLEEISEQFKDVIISFAEIDPSRAYRLGDSCKFLVTQDYFEDYMENIRINYSSTLDKMTLDSFEECLKRKSILEGTNSLKLEIAVLVKKTKRTIRKEIEGIIDRQDNPKAGEEINECMKTLFNQEN